MSTECNKCGKFFPEKELIWGDDEKTYCYICSDEMDAQFDLMNKDKEVKE